jgi:hypothetical protein
MNFRALIILVHGLVYLKYIIILICLNVCLESSSTSATTPTISTTTPGASLGPAPLLAVFQSSWTDLSSSSQLSPRLQLRPLVAASPLRPNIPPEDVSWKRRYELLLEDFQRANTLFVDERRLRCDERQAFIREVCRRENAETHCLLARQEVDRLQLQLNAKTERTNGTARDGQFRLKAGLLTAAEGLAEHAVQRDARKEKAATTGAKQAEDERRKASDLARRQQLIHSTEPFDGKLTGKKRGDWEDIAFCLGLPITSDIAVPDLKNSIVTHLDGQPDLRAGRYTQVWDALDKQRKRSDVHAGM